MKNIMFTVILAFFSILSCNENIAGITKIISTKANCQDDFECLKKGIELLPIETCYSSYGEDEEESCKKTGNETAKACSYLKKACDLESGYACFYVSEYCEKNKENNIYLEKACDLENALACYNIGFYYQNLKNNVKTNQKIAIKYFQKACDNGYKSACLMMGEPSFNCDKAVSYTEKTICSNVILSELDKKMTEEYKKLISNKNIRSKAVKTQRKWIKHTRNRCDTAKCLKDEYVKRIKDLQESPSGVPTVVFTGIYKENNYENEENSCELQIRQNGNIFAFHLIVSDVTIGATGNIYGASRDTISGVAKVNGNIAVFKKGKCSINFKLDKNKIEVTNNDCEDVGSFTARCEKIK